MLFYDSYHLYYEVGAVKCTLHTLSHLFITTSYEVDGIISFQKRKGKEFAVSHN